MAPAPRTPLPGSAPSARLLGALVVLAACVAWWSCLGGGFVWDDEQVVVGPATLGGAGGLPRLLLSPDEVKPYYRPLTRASYVLDHALWGLEPAGYHAVNLALHAANALLFFLLAWRLLGALWPPFLAALLLAVHPVGAEAVAFLSARNNLLALLFSLATALLFVAAQDRRRAWLGWASGGAFFLGLASKEPALMVGPVLLAWLYRPGGPGRGEGARALRHLVPHAVALALHLALRWIAVGGGVGDGGGASLLDGLGGRLAVTWLVVPRYLGLLLWPAGLTIFHRDPVVTPSALAWAALAWAALLGALALALRRRSEAAVVGACWLAFGFLPISNLVPIPSTVVAERFLYPLLPGLWLLVAEAAARMARSFPRAAAAQAAAWGLVLALLAGRASIRARDWRDDAALAQSALAVDPRSSGALYNLGVALKDRGDLEGASRAWTEALTADPPSAEAQVQLGILAGMQGDLAAAERGFRAALARKELAGAHFNLAVLCERTRRPAEALEHYQAFLRLAGPVDGPLVPRARARVAALTGDPAPRPPRPRRSPPPRRP